MRTVTFSNPKLQDLLNSQFVNTFTNTQGDPSSGQSIKHRPNEPAGSCIRGNGPQNVQTIFMTPAGEIFHVASGYLDAKDMFDEATFAAQLFKEMGDTPDVQRSERVAKAHAERIEKLGLDDRPGVFQQVPQMSGSPIVQGNGQGSGSRFQGENIFLPLIQNQVLRDQKFSQRFPLMNYQRLQKDPTQLVGNGRSFFSSSSSRN